MSELSLVDCIPPFPGSAGRQGRACEAATVPNGGER
jgi:hypothetical protein